MPSAPTSPSTPDPLLGSQMFWERNKVAIISAFIAIVVAAAAYGAYRYQAARRDAAAAELLAEAKVPANYEALIAQYPSASATATAYLLLAAEQRRMEKFDDANVTLQKFLGTYPKHELVATAKMAMAANLDSLNKTDEAIEAYRRIAADYPRNFNAPLAMLAQAQLLRHKGKTDEARQVCETILTQYRESVAAAEASQQLRRLKPQTPAAPDAASAQAAAEAALNASAPGVSGASTDGQPPSAAPVENATGPGVPAIAISPAASAAPTP